MISTKKFETKLVDLTVSITPAEPDGKLFTYEIWGENDDTEKAVPIYNLTRVQDKVVGAQSLICVLTREASMKQVKATRRSGVNFVKVTRRSGVYSVRFTEVKERLAVGSYAQTVPANLAIEPHAQKVPAKFAIGPYAQKVLEKLGIGPYAQKVLEKLGVGSYAQKSTPSWLWDLTPKQFSTSLQ